MQLLVNTCTKSAAKDKLLLWSWKEDTECLVWEENGSLLCSVHTGYTETINATGNN